ncbi:RadC family protein [Paenibacillaceae bacterium WGS1546]|uniref:JAB domain-containing protein n=1 Tax=Cohnella sp. WGS1546 TaxID=3366810 RepID=UPI00372D13AD
MEKGFFMDDCSTKRVDIVRLKMVRESSLLSQGKVESPVDAHEIFRQFLGSDSDRELCAVLCLDIKKRPTLINLVSIGSLDSTLIHPREVYKSAILANSASIICAHWHPSGDCGPSIEDLKITDRLVRAGEIIGIELLDHLILVDHGYFSFRENGYIVGDLRFASEAF